MQEGDPVDDTHPHVPPGDDSAASLGGGATPDANETVSKPPADEVAKRLADLEAELAKTRAERDEFKAAAYSFLGQLIPYEPITEEEIHDMLHGPRGQPIMEIIEEYEQKYLRGKT